MSLLSSLVLLVCGHVHLALCFSGGAPPSTCVTMLPGHGGSAQTAPFPYTLNFTPSSTAYTPGATIDVTLSGGGSNIIHGFLVQARDTADLPVGTMIATSAESQTVDCSGTATAITQFNPTKVDLSSVTFQWQAPASGSGDITFVVTVVGEISTTYWVAHEAETLSEDTGSGGAGSTASTSMPPQPQTSSVSPDTTLTPLTSSTQLIPQVSSSRSPSSSTTEREDKPSQAPPGGGPRRISVKVSSSRSPSSSTTEREDKPSQAPPGGGPRRISVKGGNIVYDDACGSSKGCFVNCEGKNCDYMITWRDVGMAVVFEIYGKPGYRDSWVAVGFSDDTKMGGDSVHECVTSNGMVQIFSSQNQGYSNRRLNPPQVGLTNTYGMFNDGVLYCTFTRQKSVAGQPGLFNLDQDWNIMYAQGEAYSVPAYFMQKHNELPLVSASRVDYQSFEVIGSAAKYSLVKAHGCLMILSWVLFTGVGIVMARYYKNVWAEKTLFNLKIWFQIHRSCMVVAMVLNVIAFVIIFIDVGGYSEIDVPGKKYLSSHPVLGIIVTALCLTNPIMALFRPGPDDSKRPIFNWLHWGVGMTAYILSAICICFGFQLGKSSTPDYAIYIMIVYILHIIIFDIIFELLECMMKKQKKGKVDGVEMTTQNGTDTPIPNGHYQTKETRKSQDRVKTVLLAIHVAFTGAFALVLVLVVTLN